MQWCRIFARPKKRSAMLNQSSLSKNVKKKVTKNKARYVGSFVLHDSKGGKLFHLNTAQRGSLKCRSLILDLFLNFRSFTMVHCSYWWVRVVRSWSPISLTLGLETAGFHRNPKLSTLTHPYLHQSTVICRNFISNPCKESAPKITSLRYVLEEYHFWSRESILGGGGQK